MDDAHNKLLERLRTYYGDDLACRTLLMDARHALEALAGERDRLKAALVRLRDCDWVISLPDRMDAVREIARKALGDAS